MVDRLFKEFAVFNASTNQKNNVLAANKQNSLPKFRGSPIVIHAKSERLMKES